MPARLIIGSMAYFAVASAALGMTCGTRVVTEGLSAYEVLKMCGPPVWVSAPGSLILEESWIYDLGPTQFIKRLTFQNDRLVRIEELGRGG